MREATWQSFSVISESRELLARADKINSEVCMAGMKKEEARRTVLSEYYRWAKKHPNDARMMGGFLFFRYLQGERSDLLDFRAVGDLSPNSHPVMSRVPG
jgi:hypothetical protein